MASTDPTPSSVQHWDAFWRARDKAVAQDHIGSRDPAPAEFWAAHLRDLLQRTNYARLLDIACGNGAVTRLAVEAATATGADLSVHCADYSVSAVREACAEFPSARGIACNARRIPYVDRSFDLVVSQFGLEYAGTPAFAEAARLVAGDGTFTAIVHMADGAIHDECAENYAVLQALSRCRLLSLARDAFEAGFDMVEGRIGDPEFQEFDRRLAPAVEVAKTILRDKGPLAAGGLLAKVFQDIAYMYARIPNYDREEVIAWFDGIAEELESYEGRMGSMTQAAVDPAGIERIAESLRVLDFDVAEPRQLALKTIPRPAAWILTARRNA